MDEKAMSSMKLVIGIAEQLLREGITETVDIYSDQLFHRLAIDLEPLRRYSSDEYEVDPDTGMKVLKGKGMPSLCHTIRSAGPDVRVFPRSTPPTAVVIGNG